jgi:hypothetical protein
MFGTIKFLTNMFVRSQLATSYSSAGQGAKRGRGLSSLSLQLARQRLDLAGTQLLAQGQCLAAMFRCLARGADLIKAEGQLGQGTGVPPACGYAGEQRQGGPQARGRRGRLACEPPRNPLAPGSPLEPAALVEPAERDFIGCGRRAGRGLLSRIGRGPAERPGGGGAGGAAGDGGSRRRYGYDRRCEFLTLLREAECRSVRPGCLSVITN